MIHYANFQNLCKLAKMELVFVSPDFGRYIRSVTCDTANFSLQLTIAVETSSLS